MSIVKIQSIKSLKAAVNYTVLDHKTNEDLITSFQCDYETIERDFKDVTDEYNFSNNKDRKISSRMIIQSFDSADTITPEQAHQYGVELAQSYLKDQHQYLVVTHIETDNIHNHIIFNNVNFEELKMFDSKRQNTLYNLRNENDKISEKYDLTIIEKNRNKTKYLSFNEYVARSKGVSFKSKLEEVIDKNIEKSNSFEDFLELMKTDGYENKQGKYLAFMNPKSKKYMRTKTLGMNYYETSIKYRIEHKEYVPTKPNIINRQWIDKTSQKFQKNKGLKKWATKENINYLNELNSKMYKENLSLNELEEYEDVSSKIMESFNNQIEDLDNEIYKLKNMANCFSDYQDSHSLISEFKSLDTKKEKMEYKKKHYPEFKRFDVAKRDIKFLKKHYNVEDKETLMYKISLLTDDRNLLYGTLNAGNIELNKEQLKRIQREKENIEKQRRNKEMER